jgi:hypothetical protein
MDYPYRIPGTTGPEIIIRLGLFGTAVLANGVPLRGRGSFRRTYSIPVADGPARELQINTWSGGLRATVDGSETRIGPQMSFPEMVIAFLPIGLVVSGGLVGGAIGGMAVGVNMSIARGSEAMPIRVLSMLGTTVAAVVVWWGVLTLLKSLL